MSIDSEDNNGVYYNKNDYASLLNRILVATIDLVVIVIFAYLISLLWSLWAESPDLSMVSEFGWLSVAMFSPEYFWAIMIAAYFYLVISKRSSLKTIGYRVVRLKIVDLKGEPPSIIKMTWRFLLLIFGPFHLLIDLFWLGGDDNKQTLRDKFASTYVIKENASPAGIGSVIYARYNLLGLSLIFQEIKQGNK